MGCSAFNGSICSVTGDSCMFLLPDSKACAEIYGEGPDATQNKCEDCKFFYAKDGKRCCTIRPYFPEPEFEGDPPKTDFLEDDLVCCGGFEND
ncbi:hypothetical protein DJ90_2964 [Paenibacillus macerans]|uniref:Uncharacterized protein n=1 Tax=Paenibacillus macerans TaxID=44252 RepID=A0A090Y2Z8_PAEMA|nr:hypothetical protein DJ90_2964 [Paenibacillus macerans]OMG48353.1 hypothetical protein BK140_16815 [Paenibacillus macerans]GIP08826.1 hypothetical protein J1TS5_09960 [Paenibacillus macerans]